MHGINYELRNEWAALSNGKYDLQRLVGKKYFGMDYGVSSEDKRRYTGVDAYDVSLKWEGYIMSFVAPAPESIPSLLALNEYIGCRLEDWDTRPNHAAQAFMLFFEGSDKGMVFNTFYYVNWEIVD